MLPLKSLKRLERNLERLNKGRKKAVAIRREQKQKIISTAKRSLKNLVAGLRSQQMMGQEVLKAGLPIY